MNISSKCEYAARAVVELARQPADSAPVSAALIAANQSIPEQYLVHILLQLKHAGLVRSVRGARGGYLLAKPADSISLGDVVLAIDGPSLDPLPVKDSSATELNEAWKKVGHAIDELMKATTIRDIIERGGTSNMYYI